jgi:hypothetical protein
VLLFQANVDQMCRELKDSQIQVRCSGAPPPDPLEGDLPEGSARAETFVPLGTRIPVETPGPQYWGSKEWARAFGPMLEDIEKACLDSVTAVGNGVYLEIVTRAVDAAFRPNPLCTMRIDRFGSLRRALKETVLPELYQERMAGSVKPRVAKLVEHFWEEAYGEIWTPGLVGIGLALQRAINGCLIHELLFLVEKRLPEIAGDFPDLWLEDRDAEQRAKLRKDLDDLREAEAIIEGL